MRYRAKAQICNRCHLKEACTDSDLGREVVRPIDPWPHSEAGRFHRGLSLMLIALALLIVLVEAVRNHRLAELALLASLLAAGTVAAVHLARDFRAHPANFPGATPSHGIGVRPGP